MGSWGNSNFENDDAMDWVQHLRKYDDFSNVLQALNRPIKSLDHCHEWDFRESLAAAEVVAAALGRPSHYIPKEVKQFVRRVKGLKVEESMVKTATKALEIILRRQAPRSWFDIKDYDEWRANTENLKERLNPGLPKKANKDQVREEKRAARSQFEIFGADYLGFIRLASNEVLARINNGEIKINQLIKEELANRGLDQNGKWIGCDKAAQIHGVRL